MGELKYAKLNRILLYFAIAFCFILAPSSSNAAVMTQTTVTVKVPVNSYNSSDVVVKITKSNVSYGAIYSRTEGSYFIFTKKIYRCNSPEINDVGWTITYEANGSLGGNARTTGQKQYTNQTICGNPTFKLSLRYLVVYSWSKSGGGTCAVCPIPEVKGPVKGKLEKYSSTGTTVYRVNPSSGSSLLLGRSLSNSNYAWDPKSTDIGATYSCKYTGTLSNPELVSCKKGDTPPKDSEVLDAGKDDSGDGGDSGGSSGATPKDDSGPASASATAKTQTADYAETKCGDGVGDGTYYTNGILAGVPCDKPITELKEVLQVVKNVMNNVLLPIVGTLFTIMIILGGITYMGSNGNEQTATKAKGILTAAIIGLLITILSYFIVSLFASVIGGGIL